MSVPVLGFASLVEEEAQIADSAGAMFAAGRDDTFAGGADGWFGVGLPEDLGGAGGGMSDLAPVLEAAGAATAATCLSWTTGIVGRLLVGAAGPAGELVARIAAGDVATCVPALGCARAAAGFGPVGPDGRVSGTVLALGPSTGTLALPLVGDGEPTLVLVSAADDGVVAETVAGMDITRPWSRFTLDGVRTGSLPQIGAPELFVRWQAVTGTVFGLDSAGAARTALRMTVEYAGTRHQFGRPIASFQAYKHMCASAMVELKLAQSVAYRAARSLEEGPSSADAVAFAFSAAVQATASATSVCADAVQLHGGIGFSWESEVHRYLRRCRANEILAGGEHVERALLDAALDVAED